MTKQIVILDQFWWISQASIWTIINFNLDTYIDIFEKIWLKRVILIQKK